MTLQTHIVAIPSLSDLIDQFSSILENPVQSGVANTDAQEAVLGNVRAAFVNQDQIPIPTETSAARGAFISLNAAAERISLLSAIVEGDHRPQDGVKLNRDRDERGLLNPINLFDEEMMVGIYPFTSVAPSLRETVDPDLIRAVLQQDALALVFVDEALDWDTWMDTFAR